MKTGLILLSTLMSLSSLASEVKVDCAVGLFKGSKTQGQRRYTINLKNDEYQYLDIGSAYLGNDDKNIQKNTKLLVSYSNVGNLHLKVINSEVKLRDQRVVANHDNSVKHLFTLGVGPYSEFTTGIDLRDYSDAQTAGATISISYKAKAGIKSQDTLISCNIQPIE